MKQFLAYMIMTLAALWTAGCSDELGDQPADQPERGIVIRLSTGDLETRTNLTSQANLQHVTEVYAVLYEGTGDNATFKSVEKLAWDPTEGGSYNDINGEEFVLPQAKTDGLEAGDYTVLCVGLDDASKSVYNLKDKENSLNPAIFSTGKKLADAKASYASENYFSGELFAGWSGFEFKPDSINVVEVMLKRRVAGVLCYVTDIPTTINTDVKDKSVKKLRLALYTGEKPNNQISLCRKEVEKATDGTIKIPDDFGESDSSPLTADAEGYLTLGNVITLEDKGFSTKPGEDIYYRKEKTLSDGTIIKENSLLIGAYVIPTKATDGEVTLKVELLNKDDQVLATFNAKRDGTSENESYNIYPNYIYHIGDKPESDSTEGDQPASLLGKELTVVPQEWTKMPEVDVEFPSVPLMATMKLIDQNGQEYSREHIFDCPGVDDQDYPLSPEDEFFGENVWEYKTYQRIKLKINASLLKNNWKVTIKGNSMLYIKTGENYYETEYPSSPDEAKNGATLDLLMTTYVNKEAVDDATRTATIQLDTYDDYGDLAYTSTWDVKQYNAIIVNLGDKRGVRGFCHYDCVDGSGNETMNWGYFSTVSTTIGLNTNWEGEENYTSAKGRRDWSDDLFAAFYGSVIYKSVRPFISVSDNRKDKTERLWYLPARYELQEFLKQKGGYVDVDQKYWTSTAYSLSPNHNAYYNYIDSNGDMFDDSTLDLMRYTKDRNETAHVRQACEL